MIEHLRTVRQSAKTIALVPTMGYFHAGHLSLMEKGRELADHLVVSIFVNPAQFGPGEDLDKYPKDLERDRELAEKTGADILFTPDADAFYPHGYESFVVLEDLPHHLCGIHRPTHFRGVATVVTKLFNIMAPTFAIFGRKDYQQLMIIRKMVRDLNMPVTIIDAPTIREPDGLAMSSRNSYLTPAQRVQALGLINALENARKQVGDGELDTKALINNAKFLIDSHPDTQIDYIDICDPETLETIDKIEGMALMALAVKVGTPRLIDNMMLCPPGIG